MDKKELLQLFDKPIPKSSWPDLFPYPFYHKADGLALKAAEQVKRLIEGKTQHNFDKQGKMFGVLVVEYKPNKLGFLMGYSGKLQGDERPSGFVPPIVDVHQKNSFFKQEEKRLDALTEKIEALAVRPEFINTKKDFQEAQVEYDQFIKTSRSEIKENKVKRKKIRAAVLYKEKQINTLSRLNKESQMEQISYKKEKNLRYNQLFKLEKVLFKLEKDITELKTQRANKSKNLQDQVFKTASFLNYMGGEKDLLSLFKDTYEGVPPAGAGECSAPRLLQSCYKMGFKPITFTEFWWGAAPKKQLRKHNTHYAACKGKCEPILSHMLKGIEVEFNPLEVTLKNKSIEVLYEDNHVLIANKPFGLLSVPGKNIKQSVVSILKKEKPSTLELYAVHRLDRQTSGVLLLAKNKTSLSELQMQFEKRKIKKEYIAILDGVLDRKKGTIVLPLTIDYNDRPRQMVCFEKGKYAETKFKLLSTNKGLSRVRFFPKTGRSHQLRAHSAFHNGLNIAIMGDDLYGKHLDRMYLHAEKLVFRHPETKEELVVCAPAPF